MFSNPFTINNAYKEKNKVLNAFYNKWYEGERKTSGGHKVTGIGRALTPLEIIEITELSRKTVDSICYVLEADGFIEMTHEDVNRKNHYWLITKEGIGAYNNNHYQNQLGQYNRTTVLQVGAFFVSLIALCISVSSYQLNKNNALKTAQDASAKIDSAIADYNKPIRLELDSLWKINK